MILRLNIVLYLLLFYWGSGVCVEGKVIICGVCKNVEHALSTTIESIETLGSYFTDYQVFIYENNSLDRTKEILQRWQSTNRRAHVESEDLTMEELKAISIARTYDLLPCRMEIIAHARNKVLSKAMSYEYEDYEYIMMVDMDSPKKWDVQGVLSSFNQTEQWDAILANGIYPDGKMYDYYAWRDTRLPLGPEVIGEVFWQLIKKAQFKFSRTSGLVPVDSAFGGLGIYKRAAIRNCLYNALPCRALEMLVEDSLCMNKTARFYHYFFLKSQKMKETHSLFINNSGYDQPIVCEHVGFHAQMRSKGFDKIFMNPNMVFYW